MDAHEPEKAAEARWRAIVEASLGGKSIAEALTAKSFEGLALEPVYGPGALPRGGAGYGPLGPTRSRPPGIVQRVDLRCEGPARSVALEPGAEALFATATRPEELDAVLADERLAKVPLLLDSGPRAPQLARVLAERGRRGTAALYDPFGSALRRWGLDVPLEGALDDAGALVRDSTGVNEASEEARAVGAGRALSLSLADVIDAGGHGALAVGYALAATIELMRRLEARGVEPEVVLEHLAFVVAPGTDVYAGIALVRALRLGLARVLHASALPASPAFVLGTTSLRSLSRLDRPTNLVRVTLETFALLAGGADVVAARSYDEMEAATALGHHLSVSFPLVLAHESHLGRVRDPAFGSYFVESLTDGLARAGWAEMQRIEGEGGLVASLQAGRFQLRVEQAAEARLIAVATRRLTLVGVNDFVDEDDPFAEELSISDTAESTRVWPIRALAEQRDAQAFEVLHARSRKGGKARRARLAIVGDARKARAREAFARKLFAAAGLAIAPEGEAADVVVVCGTDEAYAEEAERAVRAAKGAGAKVVVLAGKPGALSEALEAAGLDEAIHLGCNVVAIATRIFDRLERDR